MEREGRRISIRGIVQGVGFRPWVYRQARQSGVHGRVRNDAEGVTIEAFGQDSALERFVRSLERDPLPAAAVIKNLEWEPIPAEPTSSFMIEASTEGKTRRLSIPPDIATCSRCLKELRDPGDRRYRYPFTNCTHCGPRYTIAEDVPYDRPTTTMAPFRMCPTCAAEYESPVNRRFHAQPNACPACGPQLRFLASDATRLHAKDPLAAAANAIADGLIVAIKGLGGFHLACDATNGRAVSRLRRRKNRERKPFAIMVRDLEIARVFAHVSHHEGDLLTSSERPIVLLRRRQQNCLAAEVAPQNPMLGVFLPYTPLHHVLLAHAFNRGVEALVMTSANIADEPIVCDNAEALRLLPNVADRFLVHDRNISTRCDDSVTQKVAGGTTVFRRARGFVPHPIDVWQRFREPVLACGADLKNTFCLGFRDQAYLGPHIGDLHSERTFAAYEEALRRMEKFLHVHPRVIAHDLHPGYAATKYAIERPAIRHVAVQHHHAHVASAMAEHGLRGPVLGVAYDGTGHGTDGTSWGSELLLTYPDRFVRLATFRPLPLAGGDKATVDVWRIALALLNDAFSDNPPLHSIPLFAKLPAWDLQVVDRMIKTAWRTPLAHGMGRYFDAFGALVLGSTRSHFEGEVAMQWNWIADASETGDYAFAVDFSQRPWVVDLRPMTRAVVADMQSGVTADIISAKFHNTVVCATTEIVERALRLLGTLPVVLTGGCFQNVRLVEHLVERIGDGVHIHRQVPPGDGGIALGQAVVANAIWSKE